MTATPNLLCDCADPDCPGRVPMSLPFGFAVDMMSDDTRDGELYLTVRTSSWDFGGERTDIHDVLSLLWAAALRVREVASTRLVTVLNPITGADSEIYARYILLAQPGELGIGRELKPRAEVLSRESAQMDTLMFEVFDLERRESSLDPEYSGSPDRDWIARVRRRLRLNENTPNWEARARAYTHTGPILVPTSVALRW